MLVHACCVGAALAVGAAGPDAGSPPSTSGSSSAPTSSILRGFAGLRARPRVNSLAQVHRRPVRSQALRVLLHACRCWWRWPAGGCGWPLAIAAILLGANVTTQLLKPLLAAPRPARCPAGPVGAASWPSGHATAAMSLAPVLVLAAPARLRPAVAALGAAFAVAVSYSFLTLGWHYPSDVFGGFLVAAHGRCSAWRPCSRREPQRRSPSARASRGPRLTLREALGPPAAAALGGAGWLAVLVAPGSPASGRRLRPGPQDVRGRRGGDRAPLGLALATGVMLALRRELGRGSARAPTAALRRRWPPG